MKKMKAKSSCIEYLIMMSDNLGSRGVILEFIWILIIKCV
ncbi:hypothetical protein RDI58_015547 [Solanum bulbocastanum]|uniref:Uncharacterized protein n=1 Tax=Solanum bulbocastanum TaxID=147425 RepID=A0AAN8TKQ3_SOLBU